MTQINKLKKLIPKPVKQVIKPIYYKVKKVSEKTELDPKLIAVKNKLKESRKIIDLGCGNNPVEGATIGVDFYIEPYERALGEGIKINIQEMKEKGITFLNTRIDSLLPFKDKEFDFVYSHHVFEHLDDPGMACSEAMRIGKSGVIITPLYFQN